MVNQICQLNLLLGVPKSSLSSPVSHCVVQGVWHDSHYLQRQKYQQSCKYLPERKGQFNIVNSRAHVFSSGPQQPRSALSMPKKVVWVFTQKVTVNQLNAHFYRRKGLLDT